MNFVFTDLPKNSPLDFEYQFYKTAFGTLLIVSWQQNIVFIGFADSQTSALQEARARFPEARFYRKETAVQKNAVRYLKNPKNFKNTLALAWRGTALQKRVWKKLAKMPFGTTLCYSDLAKKIKHPGAVRAVASAVAKNPLALLVPCHRVLPKHGGTGNYHWGSERKKKILAWEQNTPK